MLETSVFTLVLRSLYFFSKIVKIQMSLKIIEIFFSIRFNVDLGDWNLLFAAYDFFTQFCTIKIKRRNVPWIFNSNVQSPIKCWKRLYSKFSDIFTIPEEKVSSFSRSLCENHLWKTVKAKSLSFKIRSNGGLLHDFLLQSLNDFPSLLFRLCSLLPMIVNLTTYSGL